MRRRDCEITAELEIQRPGDDGDYAYPKVLIEYRYTPGWFGRGPSYASGGDPPEPPEIEYVKCALLDADGLNPPHGQVEQWAMNWLESDHGYEQACLKAEQ